jgi:hypothetical protein
MDQKRAYLLGVSDLMRVAIAYREKHGGNEPKQQEMIGILHRGLGQVHLNHL